MKKGQVKKLTIKDIIAKKDKINDKKVTKELFITSLGGSILVQKPDKKLLLDALEMDQTGDAFLVYQSTIEPNLKDSGLQKEFGCVEPLEVVDKIFEPGEVTNIAKELMAMSGYGDSVKIVDDIKN